MATNERFMLPPPEAVWDALADPGGYGYWVVGSKTIRGADPGWPAPGSRFHHKIGVGPLRLRDHTESLEARPPELLRLRAKGRPLGTATVTLAAPPRRRDRRTHHREPRGVSRVPRSTRSPTRHEGAQRRVADAPGGAGTPPMTSVWLATRPQQREFPALEEDIRADVAVIGGGIVGITTALVLQEEGVDVVLLEANRLAHGVSGHTTAKVTSQHGLIYTHLRSRFGADGARAYGEANQAALEWIAGRVAADAIECDFRRRPAYAYVTSASERGRVEEEARRRGRPGSPPCSWRPSRCRSRWRPPCASPPRPSSMSDATWARSATS